MATIKTRMNYDESVLNHSDCMEIIAKQEKLAVKFNMYNDVTVHIDSEGTIFYDIQLYIRTCKELDNGHWMYLYFQFVPKDKYFCLKSENWNDVIANYPPEGKNLYETLLSSVLDLQTEINAKSFAEVNSYLSAVRNIAQKESKFHIPQMN
jgi:hypothetical protein